MVWLTVPENSMVPDPSESGELFWFTRFFFNTSVPWTFRSLPEFMSRLSNELTMVPDEIFTVQPEVMILSADAREAKNCEIIRTVKK